MRHDSTPYDVGTTALVPLMTVNGVAQALAISRDSVYRLVRSGDLRAVRVGERLRFRPVDVEAYLERGPG